MATDSDMIITSLIEAMPSSDSGQCSPIPLENTLHNPKLEDQNYPTNQISHINNDDSIIMKINIPPGAKAIMFFIVLICTSNFELHLCIFNGSCTFIFWVWIRYVKSETSGQFTLLRKVKRVLWEGCRREKEEKEEIKDVERLLEKKCSHYEDKSFLPPR